MKNHHLKLRLAEFEEEDDRRALSKRAAWMTFLILLLLELGFAMLEAPRLRIFEQIITCRTHNQHDLAHFAELLSSPEDNAKIQSELALIIGWGDTLSAAADILVAVPFGLLADRYGRRPALRLNLAGILLSSTFVLVVMQWWSVLPLRSVWFSAVFNFVGGGPTVTASLFFMIIADVSTEVQRISYFSLLAIAGLAGQVIGAPLASTLMMQFDPWVPVYLASVTIFVAVSLSLLMPETLRSKPSGQGEEAVTDEKTPLIGQFPRSLHDDDDDDEPLQPEKKMSIVEVARCKIMEAAGVMIQDQRVLLLLVTFPLHVISRSTMKLLLQYVTQRYSWSMAAAGFLNSLRASVNILLLVLILPLATKLLLGRFKLSNMRKDLTLARVSMLLLTIGSFTIAASPNVPLLSISLIVYTLGTGFALFVRSLATSMVRPDQVGRLYSAMTVFDAFGQMTAGPLLAEIFHIGLERSKVLSGLPFVVGGIMHGVVLLVVLLVKVPKEEPDSSGIYILVEEPQVIV